jgi:sRNA-binding regulator protein Hfq
MSSVGSSVAGGLPVVININEPSDSSTFLAVRDNSSGPRSEFFIILTRRGGIVVATNRKLIRPSLAKVKEQMSVRRSQPNNNKKPVPTEHTNAENFYYVKQMQSKTPMVVVLRDGEEIQGTIEWYDKTCLKLNRDKEPNLLLYKPNIKYMYKA